MVEEEGELVLSVEDTQMVASLTERLVRSIRVEQSVVRRNHFVCSQFTKSYPARALLKRRAVTDRQSTNHSGVGDYLLAPWYPGLAHDMGII